MLAIIILSVFQKSEPLSLLTPEGGWSHMTVLIVYLVL